MEQPGKLAAIIAALRGMSGMSPQPQTPGATGQPDIMNGYRQYAMSVQEQGQTPMPLEQWAQQQQGGGMQPPPQPSPQGMPQGMPYR